MSRVQKRCIRTIPNTFDRFGWLRCKTWTKHSDSSAGKSKTPADSVSFRHTPTHTRVCVSFLCIRNPSEMCKQTHSPRDVPMHDGRGLSQALLSPVIHFSVEAPCRVYPGSHLYVMLLPAKWPWSLTFRPNWGTPGSSQWDNSKPKQKETHRQWRVVLKKTTTYIYIYKSRKEK